MSALRRERVETVTHSDWVGEKCDGCGVEHLYEESTANRFVPRPEGWTELKRTATFGGVDLCPGCTSVVHAFVATLKEKP